MPIDHTVRTVAVELRYVQGAAIERQRSFDFAQTERCNTPSDTDGQVRGLKFDRAACRHRIVSGELRPSPSRKSPQDLGSRRAQTGQSLECHIVEVEIDINFLTAAIHGR